MIKVHEFYRRYDLRLHEIQAGEKAPLVKGWPDTKKKADDVEPLLFGIHNKYGWILDDCHFVLDVDVHCKEEDGKESLAKLEEALGFLLDDRCGAVVQTPSGGLHYYFRKPEDLKFGKVFKQFYPGLDFIAGKGKQVVAANSAHDKFPGFYFLADNAELWDAPQELLDHVCSLREPVKPAPLLLGDRSGDDFNKSQLGLDVLKVELQCRGYSLRWLGDFYEFDRPGKTTDSERSGFLGKKSQQGNYQLACFSLSDDTFPTGESMAIFHAYALLCHYGNHTEAAEALYERGFAKPKDDVDLTKLLAVPVEEEEIPDDLLGDPGPMPDVDPPGFLREVVQHNLRTSMYPQPELALGGALALLGTITGRKVAAGNMRTNVYAIGVAPSGAGKEHARQLNKSLLFQAGGEKLIGPERVASSAGIVSTVCDHPAVLFQLDEIAKLLQAMKNGKYAPHLANVGAVLIVLESSANTIWVGDAYADAKRTKRINQPHACVYGTSVPEDFWTSLSADDIKNGLIGRMMLFESAVPYPDFQKPDPVPLHQSLIDQVAWWLQFAPGGNLNQEHPQPLQTTESKEASNRLQDHFQAIAQRRVDEAGESAALWSRSGGRAQKLALLFACSRSVGCPSIRIELEDVERAIRLSNWMTRRMLYQAAEYVAANEVEDNLKKVLRVIPSVGGISQNDLTRRTQWLRKREREEILATLVEGRMVASWKEESGKKWKIMLRRVVRCI